MQERALAWRGSWGEIAGIAGDFRWGLTAVSCLPGHPQRPGLSVGLQREERDTISSLGCIFWVALVVCPAKLSFAGKRRTVVFPRLTICKSYGQRKLPGRQQGCHKRAPVACQAGGPEGWAPPAAVLGGRPAPPRVIVQPVAPPPRAGGHAAGGASCVPRPAPGIPSGQRCTRASACAVPAQGV